jgi:transcriptional regulator with PAS, ATPase and Fis domain
MQEKRFRQDLYYRLNICPIPLASLRSPGRREDIKLLAEYILNTSTICGPDRKKKAITKLALEALHKHHWPGNVRELRNVMERAVLLETTDKIGLDSIVIEPTETESAGGALLRQGIKDFSLQKAERELIARALHETGWQKTQAASLLGITRATLYAKVKQYNIQRSLPGQHETPFASNPSEQGHPVEVA